MATSSQDGTPGAGPHAQTEAVGLGPAAVVRLERALAHEVSPLLHSHVWICAEGSAGYKVGRCRRGQTKQDCRRHARVAVNTGLVQGTGIDRARSNSSGVSRPRPPCATKTAYGEPTPLALSGDTPSGASFSEEVNNEIRVWSP